MTTPGGRSRTIGSDFESIDLNLHPEPEALPWAGYEKISYAETGRQVLETVTHVLAARGFNEVFVPSYLCESMIEPFQHHGWRVTPFNLTDDLQIGEAALEVLELAGASSAVLLASYFGRLPTQQHVKLARGARNAGAFVIEDETHRVFTPGGIEANVTFASLRKLLPVADGAYVTGDDEIVRSVGALPEGALNRWQAMDLKREFIEGRSVLNPRKALVEANEELEIPGRMFGASSRTLQSLVKLPYSQFAETRASNARALTSKLSELGVRVLNRVPPGLPSHLVAIVDDPIRVQRDLSERGIFAPIHWGQPEGFSVDHWRGDLISLPIDHRYGESDMRRIAAAMEEVLGHEG
ncbi:MAG: DegT/DnrJ/EryC1/StrS aminotransferase family protein [Cryobacterium sp.]|nr:DegT/DnrJ/EryC1/StrS aminotransferase family protein [Cryobacterium sp.]